MHPQVHDPKHVRSVRTVAAIEFTKGVLVVLAGLGVFTIRHRDIWGVAESLLEFVHANPHRHFVGIFINVVYRIHDVQLWKIALVAGIYAILRLVEAYGLWYTLPWAEWLAFASGAVYVPFEISDLIRRPTWFAAAVLVVNLLIVLYMLFLRLEAAKNRLEASVHRHAEG